MTNDLLSYENIVDVLIEKVPELRLVLEEHLHDQGGELLRHVFFGDLTRFVMRQVRSRVTGIDSSSSNTLARILDVLEQASISPDDNLRDLVGVSFLENLDPSDDGYEELKAVLGPNLKQEIKQFWD